MGCYTVSTGKQSAALRWIVVVLLGSLDPEDEGTTIRRDARNLPVGVMSQNRCMFTITSVRTQVLQQ
jgi:hypothetical protein